MNAIRKNSTQRKPLPASHNRNAKNREATVAYCRNLIAVCELLTTLENWATERDCNAVDWSHVGDMAHVHETLQQLVDSIKGGK